MAEVTYARNGELIRKLFEICLQHPDGIQARDALALLASAVTMTAHEKGEYKSGGRRFEKITRFATVAPTKAGWFLKVKGQWHVTDEGRAALERYRDPEQFYREAVKLYSAWAPEPSSDVASSASEADDAANAKATITFEEAEEQAWAEIETHLRAMNPYEFQEMVAALLRGMGYHVSWVAPPGKDGGIDILAWSDPLGTSPPRIKVQVKRQQQAVSVEGLRSFMAVLGDDDVGLFVCTGGFTKDARDEARTQEKRRVTLVDLERLVDLWIENYGKLDEPARRRLTLQPIWFLAPLA